MNFLNENSCLSFIVYYIDLHHTTLSFLIILKGEKAPFRTVPIPLETPFTSQRLGETPRPLWESGRKSVGFSAFLLCFVAFWYIKCFSFINTSIIWKSFESKDLVFFLWHLNFSRIASIFFKINNMSTIGFHPFFQIKIWYYYYKGRIYFKEALWR